MLSGWVHSVRIFFNAALGGRRRASIRIKQESSAMKSYALVLVLLAVSALVCPSCARYAQGGHNRKRKTVVDNSLPTEQQKKILERRAMIAVHNEMGDDADEDEMMRRVDELTNMRLRENFPDAFKPKKKFHTQRAAMSDDIWENGTVVRYMARVVAALLAVMTLYAFKEQLLGRETWDGKKIGGNSERKMDGKKNQ